MFRLDPNKPPVKIAFTDLFRTKTYWSIKSNMFCPKRKDKGTGRGNGGRRNYRYLDYFRDSAINITKSILKRKKLIRELTRMCIV